LGLQPCVALVGPTGVGKTAFALELARLIGAEIVNADSRQVYRGLDIGSAKPTPSERALVPHHLFDVVNPDEGFDCARYRVLALGAIREIQSRDRRVLLVGGTGLYLKALRFGLFPGPARDANLRAQLEAEEDAEPGALHRKLRTCDPESAARLHPNDRARLVRALEVQMLTGKPMSAWQKEHGFREANVSIVMLGLALERSRLRERIAARCRLMVDRGLIEEVRGLWARGYHRELPVLQSIGYREMGAVAAGEISLEEGLVAMTRATCQLAKRQMTWFRGDSTVEWHNADETAPHDLAPRLQLPEPCAT
jgi:tRNA dimethylallyltransferase